MKRLATLAAIAALGACGQTTVSSAPTVGSAGLVETPPVMQSVAQRYSTAAKTLTGIDVATYGNIVRKDRRPAPTQPRRVKPAQTVIIDGKVFDVYQIDKNGNPGTVYVERPGQE